MWAAGEGYNEICIALLDAGAETDILNATNYTAGSDLNARNLYEAKNHSEAPLQWPFYLSLEPLSNRRNRPNNRLKKWLKPTTGGHPKTSLESANLRMDCELILRNLKFQCFVT